MTSIQVSPNSVISSVAWHGASSIHKIRGDEDYHCYLVRDIIKGCKLATPIYVANGIYQIQALHLTPPHVSPCCDKAHCPDRGRVLTPTLWE
jgi:hypothetical protein